MEFEKSLERLEEIARRLESKEISLEDGIALYEEGLDAAKKCLKSLSESKGRITALTREMEKLTESPFGDG